MRPVTRLPLRPRPNPGRAFCVLLLVLSMGGCGKKGPPLPPLKHGPAPITQIRARQRGMAVSLIAQLPTRNMDGSPLAPVREVRIQRLSRNLFPPGFGGTRPRDVRAAVRQFNREAARVATLRADELARGRSGGEILYTDPNPVGATVPEGGRTLTYAMSVVDINNESSPLSPFVVVRVFPPPLPPSNLQVEMSETRIRLRWEPPALRDEEEVLVYNVYRSVEGGPAGERPRNPDPLPQTLFDDENFRFGENYRYTVRSVSKKESMERESVESIPLRVLPLDVYPPAAPTGMAVSAGEGLINIYWFPNDERDLGGYRVYRSQDASQGFELIGSAVKDDITFVDRDVLPGVKYYYTLAAVDTASPPNESEMSAVHGDRLPPAKEPLPAQEAPGED